MVKLGYLSPEDGKRNIPDRAEESRASDDRDDTTDEEKKTDEGKSSDGHHNETTTAPEQKTEDDAGKAMEENENDQKENDENKETRGEAEQDEKTAAADDENSAEVKTRKPFLLDHPSDMDFIGTPEHSGMVGGTGTFYAYRKDSMRPSRVFLGLLCSSFCFVCFCCVHLLIHFIDE